MFLYPVLDTLNNGRVVRKFSAMLLQVVGVLSTVGALILVLLVIKFGFQSNDISATLGGIVFAAVLLFASACNIQIYLYRARKILALEDSEITIIPIVSIVFRLIGELYCIWMLSIGLGGCLFIWLAHFNPQSLLSGMGSFMPPVPTSDGFLGGIFFLVYLSVFAAGALLFFYFLAECSLIAVDMAKNLRKLAENSDNRPAGVAVNNGAIPVSQPTPGGPSMTETMGWPDHDAFIVMIGNRLPGVHYQ